MLLALQTFISVSLSFYSESNANISTLLYITQKTFLGALEKFRKSTISFVMSLRPSVRMENLGSPGRIFVKFDILLFFEKLSRKFKFH